MVFILYSSRCSCSKEYRASKTTKANENSPNKRKNTTKAIESFMSIAFQRFLILLSKISYNLCNETQGLGPNFGQSKKVNTQ